ncbi:MBL fold metallo-hydrolase [Brevundimonas sp.]|uniref:MBL fold metallo-hydrolase n=1 Tax=Brevundimonas sp. TaxID=1871086 RepID=UPI002D45EFCA|nr:MBL fold metallo-hydrolase [Brevundimonas sp.]HYC67826.1 MBL fold metallo-hydrolase [Brevundimonas sp.]
MIPFVRELDVAYGRADRVSPLIRRVIAANPGPFTFTGTGTYLIGRAEPGAGVAVLDPGPPDESHLAALLKAVEGQTVTHVLVTHTHRDHSPLARPFAEAVGAPVLAARPPARVVHVSAALDEEDDEAFAPDVVLTGGEMIGGDGWTIEALATPGHASNHLAFVLREENALFSGDHVMGWSTTVVAPPDGDMTTYMASLDAVIVRGFSTLWPTHGAPITEPGPFLAAYRAHRLEREGQIVSQLTAGPRRIADMVPTLYAAVDSRLWPAAGLSVWAHLIALERAGRARAEPEPAIDAVWSLA